MLVKYPFSIFSMYHNQDISDVNANHYLILLLPIVGKVKCAYCDLMMHPGSMNRHIARVHTEQSQLKCVHCGNNYKGEVNFERPHKIHTQVNEWHTLL